jgi:lipopolysaccharide/colanic/teichoic acid biosynthesis glycosyltransferase
MRRVARFLTLASPFVLVLACSKVHAAWVADPPYDFTSSFRLPWALSYAAVLAVAAYASGLPDAVRGLRSAATSALVAVAVAAAAVSALQLVVGDALLPRFVVFGSAAALLVVLPLGATVASVGRARDEGRDRVVLVGAAEEAQRLLDDLGLAPERPAVVVAHLEPAAASGPGERPLVARVLAERASVIVLDREAQLDDEVVAQAASLHEAGLRVRTLVQFYEEWLGKLPVGELERASLFFDIGELHEVRYGRVKRLIDLVCGLAGLVPLALVTPVVLVGDLVANRGPLLYRQVRVGRGGEPFSILKFRTMAPAPAAPGGAGDGHGEWTAPDDPRITAFGRLLRTTHLDELPQVVNIVRGDLSVVGPRPEQPRYVAELSAKLPFYGMRHLVRPGLTGWAQVKYGYAGDERDALEKLQYEFFYLRHQGLRFDLRVMGRTVRSVVGGAGRGR